MEIQTPDRQLLGIGSGLYLLDTPHGWATITPEMLDDLSGFTGLSHEAALERLRTYEYGRMAKEWARANPKTIQEMIAFYGSTDAYVWSLTLWQAAGKYTFYHKLVNDIANRLHPSSEHPKRALDYGSGIGTSAIWLAERGFDVTIVDVPGISFDYTQFRLRRRGIPFTAIPITSEMVDLGEAPFDAIACFDVLEHVRRPDLICRHLLDSLTPDGLISIVAPFDETDDFEGYHLRENAERFGGGRFDLWLSGQGLARQPGGFTWHFARGRNALVRRAQYRLWRATGLDIRYKRPG